MGNGRVNALSLMAANDILLSIFLLYKPFVLVSKLQVSICALPPGLPSQLFSEEAANSAGDLWAGAERLHRPGVCATPAHVCKCKT